MTRVAISSIPAGEFKAKCLKLMAEVQRTHQPLTITKRGIPIARLVPLDEQNKSLFGYMQNSAEIHGDIVEPIDVTWDAMS